LFKDEEAIEMFHVLGLVDKEIDLLFAAFSEIDYISAGYNVTN
jgi:hypothetical protein